LELIAISDIYADTTQTRALLNKLGKQGCDERIIVVAGDIGIKTAPKTKTEKVLKMLSTACKHLIYVPRNADEKDLKVTIPNAINVDKSNYIVEEKGLKIGFIGLGGAPSHSVRPHEPVQYLWNENIPIIAQGLKTELKINIEKLMQHHPDYVILVTHSPPYGIADRSKPITIQETIAISDLLEEILQPTEKEITPKPKAEKKIAKTPRHLGSRLLREFIKYYKPDIHIFGHVHKEGGKTAEMNGTKLFNVSHLAPLPYKLTSRKFLKILLTKKDIITTFHHTIPDGFIPFDEFIEVYL